MQRPTIVATDDTIHQIVRAEIEKYGDDADLNHIDVSNITNMSYLFQDSKFQGDISKWDVTKVSSMISMFYRSPFNGDISNWNVSNVTNMECMFFNSQFQGDISKWDVSNVISMSHMFYDSLFNGDISQWNVSNVTDMSGMFQYSIFNNNLFHWEVSNVTNMDNMFQRSRFNGDISNWNVSNVMYMGRMFENSSFDGDISSWTLHANCDVQDMLQGRGGLVDPPRLQLESIALYQDALYYMFGESDQWMNLIAKDNGAIKANHGVVLFLLPDQAPQTIHPELTLQDRAQLQMLYQLTGSVHQSVTAWEQQRKHVTPAMDITSALSN